MNEIHLPRWRNFFSHFSNGCQLEEEQKEQVDEVNKQLNVDTVLIRKTEVVGTFKDCTRGKAPGMDNTISEALEYDYSLTADIKVLIFNQVYNTETKMADWMMANLINLTSNRIVMHLPQGYKKGASTKIAKPSQSGVPWATIKS